MARKRLIGLVFILWLAIEAAAALALVRAIGGLETFLLAFLLSVSGYLLLRGEGVALATRLAGFIRHARRTGEVPPLPLAESLPRLCAGMILVLPGFAKDVFAVLVLLPPLRGIVTRRVERFVADRHHAVLRDRGIIDVEGDILGDSDDEGDDESEDDEGRDRGGPKPDFGDRRRLPPP